MVYRTDAQLKPKLVWSPTEIVAYRPVQDDYLQQLYERAGIPETDPQERGRYLADDFLRLTMTDHDLLMHVAGQKGRPEALNCLEKMAIVKGQERNTYNH